MNKRIEDHVNALFANAPKGSNVADIKEELLANLNDKYNDLITAGKSEDEAFALVISGIGDIENLWKDLGEAPEYHPLEIEKNQQKGSIFISIGIALYILSLAPVIFFSSRIGLMGMFLLCAAATGFIVYASSIRKINYTKTDNSFVEEYKEKIADDNDRKRLRNAMTSAMWSLIVVFYLAFSFLTWNWTWSWIIFLIGACLQQIISYMFTDPARRRNLWHGILWTITVIIYLSVSFATWAWAWSWMIFLIAVAVEQIIRLIVLWKKVN